MYRSCRLETYMKNHIDVIFAYVIKFNKLKLLSLNIVFYFILNNI